MFGNEFTQHTKTYHFKGLTGSQSASLASQVVGGAVELVRDGFHVTRDVQWGHTLVLKWQKRLKRVESEEGAETKAPPRYPELWGEKPTTN